MSNSISDKQAVRARKRVILMKKEASYIDSSGGQ